MTVQIGTNLHNDYSDYVQGADRKETRVGHTRATAMGWITPWQTCCAASLTLSITLLTGIALIAITNQYTNRLLWFLILSSVFNAFAYTAGPFPLGYIGLSHCSIAYHGLGDIFVFLYFGLVATYMLPYLLYLTVSNDGKDQNGNDATALLQIIVYGIQVGLLSTNIIVVNNLRDCETDVLANKRTTTVRFDKAFSRIQYRCNLLLSYTLVFATSCLPLINRGQFNVLDLSPLWATAALAYREVQAIMQKNGADLNQHVGGAAKVQFIFCIVLTLRLVLIPS
jgi:1,4-dihydroxy-2-naphthoate polyprenyltransferase